MPDHHDYLPAMGRAALLPLYDPLSRVLGVRAAHRRLVDQAGIEPGNRVLEIGCGTGNLLLLAKRAHPRAAVVGLDPDEAALARARRKAERAGLDVQLDRGFAGELPYPDASVDRVLSALMFHHLPAPEKRAALREVRRVLAPGGSLHMLDIDRAVPRSTNLVLRLAHLGRHHGGPHGVGADHLADNTSPRIRALMEEAGLTGPAETDHGRSIFGQHIYYRAFA
jgi:ubiquinone/menaquinone biosynthesis C-methylase UbiE